MAQFEGKDRRVSWFNHSTHPLFRKAGESRSMAEQLGETFRRMASKPVAPPSVAPPPAVGSMDEQLRETFRRMPSKPGAPPVAGQAPQPAASKSPPVDPERKKIIDPDMTVMQGNVADHVIQQLKLGGIAHDPSIVEFVTKHLMKFKDEPSFTHTYGNAASNPNLGWKLRLNTGNRVNGSPNELEQNIIQFLNSQGYNGYSSGKKDIWSKSPDVSHLGTFKFGAGGDEDVKNGIFQNFTIYTGDRKSSETLAEELERQFGSQLSPKFHATDTRLRPHVGARFVYDSKDFPGHLVFGASALPRFELDNFKGSSWRGIPLPAMVNPLLNSKAKLSTDTSARYLDVLWSILSPEFYGPPVFPNIQKERNSMKSWFSHSVHPLFRKAEISEEQQKRLEGFVDNRLTTSQPPLTDAEKGPPVPPQQGSPADRFDALMSRIKGLNKEGR